MGRPREHNGKTRQSLLLAAERLVAEGGIGAVGVGPAAERAGTIGAGRLHCYKPIYRLLTEAPAADFR